MLHFYSGQVRRFLTQFMRILNNFSVEIGKGADKQVALRQFRLYMEIQLGKLQT